MDIFSGIASVLSGGLTGIVGSVAQGIFAYKSKQLDVELQKEKYANEIELRKADVAIMAQEWAAKTSIAQTEASTQTDTEDAKTLAAALNSEPKLYHEGSLTASQNSLMVLLDFIRGIIRPGLTLYLCGITTAIYFQAKALIKTDLDPLQAYNLVTQIINTILYLTTTCVLFWFGTRNKSK